MSVSHSPGWRPSFQYSNKYTSFSGFILCLAMMFATSWFYALICIGLGAGICAYIIHRKPNIYWGSALDTRAKYTVLYHVKNYQPSFLVLCGNPELRLPLVKFTHTLRRGNGTIVYGDILCGKFKDKLSLLNNRASHYLPKYMKMRAFYERAIAPDLMTGAESLIQLTGLGKLRCDVLVLGFKKNWPELRKKKLDMTPEEQKQHTDPTDEFSNESYVALLTECLQLKMGFMLCRGLEHIPFGKMKSNNVLIDTTSEHHPSPAGSEIIDVWWLLDDGGLSLLVPHILSIDRFWKKWSALHAHEEEEEENTEPEDKDSEIKPRKGKHNIARKKSKHIIRLFLVADANIGGELPKPNDADNTNASVLTFPFYHRKPEKNNNLDAVASTLTPRSAQLHIEEVSRITSQGLVDQKTLRTIEDATGESRLVFFKIYIYMYIYIYIHIYLWQAELSALLRKFRLNINGPYPIKSNRREPTKQTLETFCQLTGYDMAESKKWNSTRLKRWLRVSELIQTYSHEQKCVFVTAPHPNSFKDPTMYLGVLDMVSRTHDKRATILTRGNGENVLTFYWDKTYASSLHNDVVFFFFDFFFFLLGHGLLFQLDFDSETLQKGCSISDDLSLRCYKSGLCGGMNIAKSIKRFFSRKKEIPIYSVDGSMILTELSHDMLSACIFLYLLIFFISLFQGHSDYVSSVKFSPDGSKIVSSSNDETVRVWDVETGNVIVILQGHLAFVNDARFSPRGDMIASCSGDNTIRLWDMNSGKEMMRLEGHSHTVTSAQFSPDGHTLVSGSWDKTIRLWDVNSGEEIKVLGRHSRYVSNVQFSPDGQLVVSSSWDSTIAIWDIQSSKRLLKLIGHVNVVMNTQFSPNGNLLVSCSWDRSIRIWDANSGIEIKKFRWNSQTVADVRFSPDNLTVVSCANDKTIRWWDVATGQQIQKLGGHFNDVTGVDFSPDGKIIVSASHDKTIRIWG
ncbi:G-protein beta WD-40 repeats containing protein [Reticulomyxa filosa]|uniref:G-protein beta WD-40 repeats containing protein n=1 Tax=Reticulomyxa filosa TaxID=46433 RepID=X6NG77_RETFI|nr:G-protein beta WD-40 repeats containing protein [Reticulomyxa filosa]|eukprot:ETO24774.1 G-protein beta WD-40 repeats containing protein [Reticulomyxa filosa]